MFPSPEQGLAFHLRLLSGDPTAPGDLVNACLNPLVTLLRHQSDRRGDPDLIESAAIDAIMSYVLKPTLFDPNQLDLRRWLLMAARGDLKNLKVREDRHHRNREEVVELAQEAGNNSETTEPLDELLEEEMINETRRMREELTRDWTEQEWRCLELQMNGERRTKVFAQSLGFGDLPPEEQRRRVKQIKDRNTQRIVRWGKSHG